jgi:hypothetical protein
MDGTTNSAGRQGRDQLAKALTHLVEVHGISAVTAGLGQLAHYRAHHYRAVGQARVAEAWQRLGMVLAWDMQVALRNLASEEGGCCGG